MQTSSTEKLVAVSVSLDDMASHSSSTQPEYERMSDDYLAQIQPTIVTTQPQRFEPMLLDPVSKTLYHSLTTKHMSGGKLQSAILGAGNILQNNIQGQFVSMKGNLSYQQLLEGLKYDGEYLLQHGQFNYLLYTSIVLSDENNQTVSTRTGGVALLTDRRLLLMSSQFNSNMTLEQCGDPKKLPGGYKLQLGCQDCTYYLPIGLRNFKSVEINGQTGVSGEITVSGSAPCCCGLCGLLGKFCCANSSLLKSWNAQPLVRNAMSVRDMRLTFGVVMPPWGKRMFVHIYVDPNVPVPVIRDFVSILQRFAPDLN